MKTIIALLLVLTLSLSLTSCFRSQAGSVTTAPASKTTSAGSQNTTSVSTQPTPSGAISVGYDNDDLDDRTSSATMTYIDLEGDKITVKGNGAVANGSKVTITYPGVYSISGTLTDGQIIVNSESQENVKLVLNGVDITCSKSAPVYIINAEKVVMTLAEGTENHITDGDTYVLEDAAAEEPNATIFSKSDLSINGSGSLTVNANYNNGIQSKDSLVITGGTIKVTSVNDGLQGRDCIAVKDGDITINSGGDGLQSTNDEDTARGYIAIDGGKLNITAGTDGIQAQTSLMVSGGDIIISSGGGSANSSSNIGAEGNTWGKWGPADNTANTDTSPSAKGLKAEVAVTITGGTLNIDSSDDSIHANNSITVSGGTLKLSSGDDGLHADSAIEINGGELDIAKSYEGIESSVITINDGQIHLVSSDDGINIVGGNDGSAIMGRPGQNEFTTSGSNHLDIYGGYIFVNANGDGVDVNGYITMTAGTVIINGPTSNMNGALDHAGFKMTGGYVLAVGSSGMAMAPGTNSTQYAVMVNFTSAQAAGTMVRIQTQDGKEILTFVPTKPYQSVVLSSPELKNGSSYVVYIGGSSTGTATNGLYKGGSYTEGQQVNTFTISGIVTNVGLAGGGFPGGGGRPRS